MQFVVLLLSVVLVTLLAFHFAEAGSGASDPIGCVAIEENTGRYSIGSCNLHEQFARPYCCDDQNTTYYILGGQSLNSNKKTHHNTAWCVNSLPDEQYVDMSWCDVGCVGKDYTWSAESWGYCGGGCDGCGDEWPCRAPKSAAAPCGYYRSVYSCDKSETPIPVPTTTPPPTTIAAHPDDPGHDKPEGGAATTRPGTATALLLAVTMATAAMTFRTM